MMRITKMTRKKKLPSLLLIPQLIWFIIFSLSCQRTSGQRSSLAVVPSSASSSSSSGNGSPGSGSSISLSEEELDKIEKEKTRNTVRLAATDQLNSEIITNRTRAYLNCESGEMIVKINFSAPFRGVAYSDYDRSSPCKFYGDGSKYYEMRLPLKGCGTKQEAPRLFINNIIVRFHRSLELEEDEIKTIICRYPPPQAPPPPSVVAPILESTVPVPVIVPAKLSEIELLLIICALLFLTLLLLGIGIAYYCLKRRNIKIIKKRKLISPAPSEITKVSTIFDQIRIPRAAVSETTSDTIPSDYPSSESDERRTIVSETSTLRNDNFRFENTAFIPEPYPLDIEKEDSITSFPLPVAHKPKITTANFVETLCENENVTEEKLINTHHKRTTACLYKKLPTSKHPPSIPDNDNWSQTETESKLSLAPYVKNRTRPKLSYHTTEDVYLTNEHDSTVDMINQQHRREASSLYKKMQSKKHPSSIPDNDNWSQTEIESGLPLAVYVKNNPMPNYSTYRTEDVYRTNEHDIDEQFVDTHHRREESSLYRSDQEARLAMAGLKSSDLRSRTMAESYVSYEQEKDMDELTIRNKKSTITTLPKLVLLKTDDFYVTNINESQVTETVTSERRGLNSVGAFSMSHEEQLQLQLQHQRQMQQQLQQSSSSHHSQLQKYNYHIQQSSSSQQLDKEMALKYHFTHE